MAQFTGYSDAVRAQVVRQYLEGQRAQEIASHHNIHFTTVHRIIREARRNGSVIPHNRGKLSESNKALALQLYKDGVCQKGIAQQLGVTQAAISLLVNKADHC